MKSGKALGSGMIHSELFLSVIHFWCWLLGSAFSVTNRMGKIPETWEMAVITPVYRKGVEWIHQIIDLLAFYPDQANYIHPGFCRDLKN